MLEPWTSFQIKRRELERQAEHYRLLSIAQETHTREPGRLSRGMLFFGRELEIAGRRLQAHYAGLTEERQLPRRLSVHAVGVQAQGDCVQ